MGCVSGTRGGTGVKRQLKGRLPVHRGPTPPFSLGKPPSPGPFSNHLKMWVVPCWRSDSDISPQVANNTCKTSDVQVKYKLWTSIELSTQPALSPIVRQECPDSCMSPPHWPQLTDPGMVSDSCWTNEFLPQEFLTGPWGNQGQTPSHRGSYGQSCSRKQDCSDEGTGRDKQNKIIGGIWVSCSSHILETWLFYMS